MKINGVGFRSTRAFYEHVIQSGNVSRGDVSKKAMDEAILYWLLTIGRDAPYVYEFDDEAESRKALSKLWGQWRGEDWTLISGRSGEYRMSDVGKAYLELLNKELNNEDIR